METKTRTIVKAVTWQLWGLFTMSVLAWFQTGSISGAFGFAVTAAVTSIIFFFAHERLWGRVRWGRMKADA